MKRFRFRLERLLRLEQRATEERARELARCRHAEAELRARLELLRAQRVELDELAAGLGPVASLAAVHGARLGERGRELAAALERARRRTEDARQRWTDARRRSLSLERLEELARERHRVEVERAEQHELEELATLARSAGRRQA
ncbi:MAG: flagellar FliJ family protein [Planctomycetota bacterium]